MMNNNTAQELLDIQEKEGHVIVLLKDEVHVENVPFLREALKESVPEDQRNIIVDLSNVTFLDSTGVGLFASLLRKANENSGSFAFAGADGQPRAVLGMVGFDQITTHYSSVESALNEIGKKT